MDIKENEITFKKVKNDSNGNPRYVCHFLNLLSEREKVNEPLGLHRVHNLYNLANQKAKEIGGKKYRGKDYGGGIVFQSYNVHTLAKDILELQNKEA